MSAFAISYERPIGVPVFRLDKEHSARVRDCLEKANLALSRLAFDRFIKSIEDSVARLAKPPATPRETHDELRMLWLLAHEDDPPVGLLRARARALSRSGIEYIDRRFARVFTRLFPGDSTNDCFFVWAESANGRELVQALRVLTAEGAKYVVGRSRGGGKRSGLRLEPVIDGKARGARSDKHKGGRPREDARHDLVINLGLGWLHATGRMPEPGRSSEKAFGELVHSVFQWLEIPDEAATYALRLYWEEVQLERDRPSLADFLRRHAAKHSKP